MYNEWSLDSFYKGTEDPALAADLAALESAIEENQKAQMAAGSDFTRLQQLTDELAQLEEKLEYKTERWMYLTELAEKIDISTNAVAKLENNLMTVSLQTLVNIANVLHLDFNRLLSRDPKRTESGPDPLLTELLQELSPRDREFILHVIKGLSLYQ